MTGGSHRSDAPGLVRGELNQPRDADRPVVPLKPSADLVSRSRSAWELGDWAALVSLTKQYLEQYEDRAKLALLAAVGLAQSGQMAEAASYARQACDWGCPPKLAARFLAGGALNSLGRAMSLTGEEGTARRYFETSLEMADPLADAELLGGMRNINEKIALGLLPEASRLMDRSLQNMEATRAVDAAQARVFASQVEHINHVLSLAQKRHQLSPSESGPANVSELERRATSQLGQDLWVLEQTNYKTGGFFVEFGATDGVLLSNTLLLESEFGWAGICAEPNPAFFRRLRANRSCTVAPDCIMGQSGQTVEFILADEYGCVADFSGTDQHAARREASLKNNDVIKLETISLNDFLKKYKAPRKIDYLSIDTEGTEYDILSAFPFEEWEIQLISVEHNFTEMRGKIRDLLESHGYICTEMQWDDWYSKAPVA